MVVRIMDARNQVLQQAVVGLSALVLLGGTMALLLLGKPVPEFLVGFDGVVVTAAFANSGFFALARTAQPTANALTTVLGMHHELAMTAAQNSNPQSSGTTEPIVTTSTEAAK